MYNNEIRGCGRERFREYDCGGVREIEDGIDLMKSGLEDIHDCEVCEGIRKCEEGICLIEDGCEEVLEDVRYNRFNGSSCGIKEIRAGIREIRRGEELAIKGICDVRRGCRRKGEHEIAAGIYKEEEGVRLVEDGLRDIACY